MVPLPGVRAVDHVGLSVPDLQQAVGFFVDVLGFEELYAHAPRHATGEVQVRQFDRHPETTLRGITMLRLGTLHLELLELDAPDQRRVAPRSSDWGASHLALHVEDLDAAARHLAAHGARVLGEPMDLPGPESGPGHRFVYAVGPGGLVLELVSRGS
jgi:glyoxylase I family protein